jgi:hypothetical protein
MSESMCLQLGQGRFPPRQYSLFNATDNVFKYFLAVASTRGIEPVLSAWETRGNVHVSLSWPVPPAAERRRQLITHDSGASYGLP